eukprot:361747-Chlamydomonas_euryale.AAC.1
MPGPRVCISPYTMMPHMPAYSAAVGAAGTLCGRCGVLCGASRGDWCGGVYGWADPVHCMAGLPC